MKNFINIIIKNPKLFIIFVIIINLISIITLFKIKFDVNFTALFSQGNPKAETYNKINQKYSSGEILTIFVESENNLLSKDNLISIFELENKIRSLSNVYQVMGIVPPKFNAMGFMIDINKEIIETYYFQILDFIKNKYFLKNQVLSSDEKAGVIMVIFRTSEDGKKSLKLIKNIIKSEKNLKLSLAGNLIIEDTLISYILRIIIFLPFLAIFLIIFIFRQSLGETKFAFLSLIPAGLGALWTIATALLISGSLNIITVISPIFIIVMGSAYGLHFISHFLEIYQENKNFNDIVKETYEKVLIPILMSALTTMAGFISLCFAKALPMRQLGFFVTLGILYSCLITITFIPSLILLRKIKPKNFHSNNNMFANLISKIIRYEKIVVVSFILITIIFLIFIPGIKITANQILFFKKNSEIRKSFEKVEKYFGGAFPLTGEAKNPFGKDIITNNGYAMKILEIERELEKIPGVYQVFSFFDVLMAINEALTGVKGYPDQIVIQEMLKNFGEENLKMWISDDGIKLMIKTKNIDDSSIKEIQKFFDKNKEFLNNITGMPILFDEMSNQIVYSQLSSLIIAFILIFLMLLYTFRNVKESLIGLIPLITTIISILGFLSLSGFNLNLLSANLTAISIGVGIDYTIHILSGIDYFRKKENTLIDAINKAINSFSKPILTNAYGLAIGMSALMLSPLAIHFQASVIMWVAMVISSSAALILLPIIYKYFIVKK